MAEEERPENAPPPKFDITIASFADVIEALRAGLKDFAARPGLSLFFGLFYGLFGLLLLAGLNIFDQIWIVLAVSVGFPLVAPFLAAGLYDMSRRLETEEAFTARAIFLSIFQQQRREFGWMAFVVLFVFWIWAYQVRLMLAINLQWHSFSTLDELLVILFTTADGAAFLITSLIVGAVLASLLFSITVISLPLLLEKNVDMITAMLISINTVRKSPVVMLGWGAMIGAITLLALAPAFLGVIFAFPILGHTTWHLYRRLVHEVRDPA